MPAAPLEFSLLGPFRAQQDGRPVDLPGSSVLRGLLGVLVLAEREPVAVPRLTDLVWPSRAEGVRPGAVHVAVCRLRGWLRDNGGGRADAPVLRHAGDGGYRLAGTVPTDLGRFRDLVVAARDEPDPAGRTALLGAALRLRRGPVLADLLAPDRADVLLADVAETARRAVLALAAAALECRRPGEAVPHLLVSTAEAPFDEPLHAWLIRSLTADRRPAEALAAYEVLDRRLRAELGVGPAEEVRLARAAALGATPVHRARPEVSRR